MSENIQGKSRMRKGDFRIRDFVHLNDMQLNDVVKSYAKVMQAAALPVRDNVHRKISKCSNPAVHPAATVYHRRSIRFLRL